MPSGIGFAVGDVSGKGIPAALLMVMVRSLLRATASELIAPEEIVARLNRFLYRDIPPSMYVTMVFCVLPLGADRRMRVINAGHANPLLLRPGQPPHVLEVGGPVLGAFRATKYPHEEAILQPGDLFVVYTDGVVEAPDRSGRALGVEGLVALIEPRRSEHPQAIVRSVLEEVRGRSEGPSRDDLTLLILKV
jgi:sigma-B regulation protein RsbU (phosphoserine phosphatase)